MTSSGVQSERERRAAWPLRRDLAGVGARPRRLRAARFLRSSTTVKHPQGASMLDEAVVVEGFHSLLKVHGQVLHLLLHQG